MHMQTPHKKIIISSYDELHNPYYGGGGAIAIHEIAKRLKKNFNVVVFCGKYPGWKDYTYQRITYKHIGLSTSNGKIGQLLFQISLLYHVKVNSFHLWIENFTPPFSTSFLPLITKKPVIGLAHMLSGEDMRRKYRIPFDNIESLGLKFYKNFIVLTKSDKRKIERNNGYASIQVIPNGTDIPRNTNQTRRRHILYVGRIEINQKGLDLLLDAYKEIVDTYPYPLVIAGNGSEEETKKLSILIKTPPFKDKVKFIGKVGRRKKHELYRKAICVVIPSRFETFSLVALESLSRGRAIITFSIPGLSWIPSKFRVTGKEISAISLQRAISFILNNPKKREHIEKNSIQFAQKFSWEEAGRQYINYINSIISNTY